jgi:hypothetical protein
MATRLNTPATAPYAPAWRDFRRRQLLMLAVYASFFPGKWLLSAATPRLHQHAADAFVLAGTLWIVAFVLSSSWAATWRCPRCHATFMRGTWFTNPCTRHCLSCGLPRGASGDTDPWV